MRHFIVTVTTDATEREITLDVYAKSEREIVLNHPSMRIVRIREA